MSTWIRRKKNSSKIQTFYYPQYIYIYILPLMLAKYERGIWGSLYWKFHWELHEIPTKTTSRWPRIQDCNWHYPILFQSRTITTQIWRRTTWKPTIRPRTWTTTFSHSRISMRTGNPRARQVLHRRRAKAKAEIQKEARNRGEREPPLLTSSSFHWRISSKRPDTCQSARGWTWLLV